MRQTIFLTFLSAILLTVAAPASAQRVAAQNEQSGGGQPTQQTKVVPAIRTQVYDRLTEAQTCLDEEDTDCALDIVEGISKMRDLNAYEQANVWNFRAYLNFEIDNVDGAIDAYEHILALPFEDLPDGMINSSMRNLATLYIQEDQLDKGLALYMQWMELPSVTPSGDDYYLLASIYYQQDKYKDAVPALNQAIALEQAKGNLGDENWYVLLYVCYYQLEQTDDVIKTLTILVNNYTKRDHILALAGQLSALDREFDTLSLYEAAYDAGMLSRGADQVQLANLLLNSRAPYLAVKVLDKGLKDGEIDSTQDNWRLLAQSYQLAQEHEKAVDALKQASTLANDGEVDRMLAESYAQIADWDNCAQSAQKAIDRGGIDRPDLVSLRLGQCLVNQKKYDEARRAFQEAAKNDESARDARRWITYVDDEVTRVRANEEALRSLRRGG